MPVSLEIELKYVVVRPMWMCFQNVSGESSRARCQVKIGVDQSIRCYIPFPKFLKRERASCSDSYASHVSAVD